jgi:hypothetical protein
MARDHGRIRHAIWANDDFRALPEAAQRAYMLAVTQPDLSFAGVVPFTLRRWTRLASDSTPAALREAFRLLEQAPSFVIIDEDTEELLLRSFLRNDGILDSPNVAKASVKAFRDIHSPMIRDAWLLELHRLAAEVPRPGSPKTWTDALDYLLAEPFTVGSGMVPVTLLEGLPPTLPSVRAHVRAAPAPAPAMATAAAASFSEPPPPQFVPTDKLPGELAVLRSKLEARKLYVRWDQLTADRVQAIVDLISLHGDAPLVTAAVKEFRADNPLVFAQGWINGWQALPAPGDRLRLVTEHCDIHLEDLPCRGCAADRKAGAM